MAEKKQPVKVKAFDPKDLSLEQQEAVVAEYLGVHPKYFVYKGLNLQPDIWNMEHDGFYFNGFKPHLRELGQL